MEEGTIVRWLKAEGESVSKDEILFELETDKAVMEVPSPARGVLLKVVVSQGPVSPEQTVGWVGNRGELVQNTPQFPLPATTQFEEIRPRSQPPKPSRIVATPAARRRAGELGVDLGIVTGKGPGGRILEEDVEAAAALKIKSVETRESQRQLDRQALIRRLSAAWQAAPHIYVSRELDVGNLIGIRERFSREGKPRCSITDLILYVISRTLPDFPELVLTWNGETLTATEKINAALAIDTDKGVIAPVIPNIGELTLAEICDRRRELTNLALKHQLQPDQVGGGNFTLTNLGMEEVDFFTPIINFPQTAILAVGRAMQKPVVAHGALGVGWRMWAILALDHRAADGMSAARFLSALQRRMNELPMEFRNGS